MRKAYWNLNYLPEIKMLAEKSPRTPALQDLIRQTDFALTASGRAGEFRKYLQTPVVAATDPASEVEYQSLYIQGFDPEDRIVLQNPTSKDQMTCVHVLKAARLSGNSGLVYCGTPEQLQTFAAKLADFEQRGVELDEAELLQCLSEAVEADGMVVIYQQLSPDHGGDEEEMAYADY